MKHAFGESIPRIDGFGNDHGPYRICKLCGMSDKYGADRPCQGWLTCGTCRYLVKDECVESPPHIFVWDHPNAGRQVEWRYPLLGEDHTACGKHSSF